ncbi:MAG: putative lipid II flippase FtsW [marine bacterium B5-7]|nr:MAG: putative lipid II flippase FtsW [marine bacterium B5-7]
MQAVIDARGHAGALGSFDAVLLGTVMALLSLSIIMVFSVTVVDDSDGGASFARIARHSAHIAVGVIAMLLISRFSPVFWQRAARLLLVAGILLLILVLIPAIGIEVNGSRRWLGIASIRVQPSELMKFIMIVFMADYLTRRRGQLKSFRLGVVNVAAVVGVVGMLLLLEPDLGSTVVIAATVFAMMYVAGVRYSHMVLCISVAATAFAALVYLSPYRLQRVLSFQDPWADPWNTGFQLSQALIAFGRGEWLGAGLGQSIQKLFYLPHAGNDFLAAVIAEELGFAGILVLITLYMLLVWRGFAIARQADQGGHDCAALIARGATILIALQAIINLGVNMGVLPTKGLTLPLVSYGGSSMIVTLMLVGLVLGVDRQVRMPAAGRGST